MSHNSSISEMGEPAQTIRVINEKRLLLIMVGINIILSCGKEYLKFAWEFICKPGQENLVFLQVKKIKMTQKTFFLVHIEVVRMLTAACKAFSLANGKGTGTNDWVIRSLD